MNNNDNNNSDQPNEPTPQTESQTKRSRWRPTYSVRSLGLAAAVVAASLGYKNLLRHTHYPGKITTSMGPMPITDGDNVMRSLHPILGQINDTHSLLPPYMFRIEDCGPIVFGFCDEDALCRLLNTLGIPRNQMDRNGTDITSQILPYNPEKAA